MPVRRSSVVMSGLAAALALILSACAAPTPQNADAVENFNDPIEDTNRAIFSFNQAVDGAILVPVAKTYRTVIPDPARQSIHAFLLNVNGPIIFANDVLQGELSLAGRTAARFVLNSTLGFGGLFDVAAPLGIPYHSNDLGVTLARWGVPEGMYLIVPVLGPSNPRDLAGQIGDGFADPGNIIAGQHHVLVATFARTATSGINERARNIESLADIERTSLDYYATIRSLYRQRRAAQIRHEQGNLPNPASLQGSDAGPPMTYSFVRVPAAEAPAK